MRLSTVVGWIMISQSAMATEPAWQPANRAFHRNVMKTPPVLPAHRDDRYISCPTGEPETGHPPYRSARQVDYGRAGWEERVAADWDFFDVSPELGKVLVIDSRLQGDSLAFRYLANGTRDDLYEPWSSSKVMAFTAAMARAREFGVGADASVGGFPIADLISSVHSYAPFGPADGNSNAIATWMLNVAGREFATSLFHDNWLRLVTPQVRIRGAYGSEAFDPETQTWTGAGSQAVVPAFRDSSDDPGYQPYACEQCGLTGNKPMTTLAQAEWLKRLATHRQVAETRHPGLTDEDVRVLFYGRRADREHPVGGMMAGIGRMLTRALTIAMGANGDADPKRVLDDATGGRWRVWQKIGWGPSETRGTAENVVLAHVCLPGFQGGRQFTVAAQASVPGNTEENVAVAGRRMQQVLAGALSRLLNAPARDR